MLIVLPTLAQMGSSVNQNRVAKGMNPFRQSLRSLRQLIGCWTSLANHLTTEIVGYAGFDWLLIDGEHAPNDISTFVCQLMALKDSPSAAVVRPQCAEPIIIKRLLDIGFRDFLLPMVESAEQARSLVAATRYPPDGFRGIGTAHRANRYGYATDYFDDANDGISVAVQIESLAGLKNLEEIAAVDGVDCLFVGPPDLCAGLGCPRAGAGGVQRAGARVVGCGRARG